MIAKTTIGQRRWLLFAGSGLVIGVIAYEIFGIAGLIYPLLFIAACAGWSLWEKLFTSVIEPRPGIDQDPIYKRNVRDLIARNRGSYGEPK